MHKIILEKIDIPYLNTDRQLRIYLPPNYNNEESFPVIYMHDGQNLFDTASSSYGAIWDVAVHLDELYKKYARGFIVVGIDNYEGGLNRLDEYSPWINNTLQSDQLIKDITGPVGGLGGKYAEFIVKVLKPYIDKHYKTNPNYEYTAIIGSSMGGLISLYAGLMYPEVFSMIGAFSTAVWFAELALLTLIDSQTINLNTKWYLDVGTHESSKDDQGHFNQLYIKGTKNVSDRLSKYVDQKNMKLIFDEGGIHHESAWSRRFEKAIEYLCIKNATN